MIYQVKPVTGGYTVEGNNEQSTIIPDRAMAERVCDALNNHAANQADREALQSLHELIDGALPNFRGVPCPMASARLGLKMLVEQRDELAKRLTVLERVVSAANKRQHAGLKVEPQTWGELYDEAQRSVALLEKVATSQAEDTDELNRRLAIVELAREEYEREGELEIDDNAKLSEGSDNGAYVASWVWMSFAGTRFDKEHGE